VTVTGEVLQWQWSLPPEKEGEPGVMPALMRGCRLKDMVCFAVVGYSFRGGSFESKGMEIGRRQEWMRL
jgi:hypothetical protein